MSTGINGDYATRGEVAHLAASLWSFIANGTTQAQLLGEKIMAVQADLDALQARVEALDAAAQAQDAKVKDAITNINSEISALQAQQVDTTNLEAAVAALEGDSGALGADVDAVDGIAPPPAPPAE